MAIAPKGPIRFGVFEADPRSGELRKSGVRVRLPEQPFRVLLALLEKPGELVTRDELRHCIWGDQEFGDLDHGLNRSVNKLREVLGDSASHSHFIETVPGRGYRFIGPPPGAPVPIGQGVPPKPASSRWLLIIGAGAILFAGVVAGVLLWRPDSSRQTALPQLVPLTALPGREQMPSFSPDGNEVAYVWLPEGEETPILCIKQIDAGDPVRLARMEGISSPAWSPDGRFIAFFASPPGFYVVAARGGPVRKIADAGLGQRFPGRLLDWYPDSERLAVSDFDPKTRFPSIHELRVDTGAVRLLAPGVSSVGDNSPAVSPDETTVAFGRSSATGVVAVWLVPADGGQPRQLTKDEDRAIFPAWTPKGDGIVFSSVRNNLASLWRIPVSGGPAVRIAAAGYDVYFPAVARAGGRLALPFTHKY